MMASPRPRGLAPLAALPENLFGLVVTHSLGSLVPRANAVLLWLQQLDKGELITPQSGATNNPWLSGSKWLSDSTERRIRVLLAKSGALDYSQDTPEVAQAVVQDILLTLEQVELAWPATAGGLSLHGMPVPLAEQKARARHTWAALHKLAEQWQHRVSLWQSMDQVAEELGIAPAIGNDQNTGDLRDRAWFDLLRLSQWVAQIQPLQKLLQLLGQQRPDPEQEASLSHLLQKMSPKEQGPQERKIPGLPMETDGITRSDNLARMLPLEAAFMGHETLRMLWHARRAEQGLLSYAVAGVMPIDSGVNWTSPRSGKGEGAGQGLQQGPIILCLDTSASMHGMAEQVSKALVLEALRLAKQQDRGCLVYLFGGTDELLTLNNQELTLPELLDMLRGSFSGGTDVNTPLLAALKDLHDQAWQQADILLVSDGEFQVSPELRQQVEQAKDQQGVRVFGLQLGYATALHAMSQLCDPVHLFSDWKTLEQAARLQ